MNWAKRLSIACICFGLSLTAGAGLAVVGVFVIPALPYFTLDAILTPEELADDAKREATLSLLHRANRNNGWLLWTAAGLFVGVLSAIGLWSLRETPAPNSAAP